MFRAVRWRVEKNKIKLVFKLQFRATQGLQDVIKLVPIDLGNRPAWYKEKVYPPNKVSGYALRSIGKEGHKPNSSSSYKADISQYQKVLPDNDRYPLAPVPEFTIDRGADIADMKKNLQNLYDCNVYVRQRFMTVQSLLEDLLQKTSHAQHSTEL